MSKAILVIDEMPDCCICCPCRYQYSDGGELCQAKGKQLKTPYHLMRNRPDWCPLRELPRRYENDEYSFTQGWNTCLDEILGE